jgi:YjzC-like protein
MKRQVPKMTTDEEAEAFLGQGLSDLDFGRFKPVRFEFRTRDEAASPCFAPGTPAPRSGVYREVGPRGGRTGGSVTIARGKPLPPAKKGRNWSLVATQSDGED